MDMMEMMDDQDGRDLFFFLFFASLFLCWMFLDLLLSLDMAPSDEGLQCGAASSKKLRVL